MNNPPKPRKATQILSALGLAAALAAALSWYYDVYVHWQPKVFPIAVIVLSLGIAALTLLVLRARGEKKAAPLLWETALSVVVFTGIIIIGLSAVINNVIGHGNMARQAAAVAVPLAAAQILLLLLLGVSHRKAVLAAGLAAIFCACALSIAVPSYFLNTYKAPAPAIPEGRFAPMPELGEVDFTVPADGSIEEVRDLIRKSREGGTHKHFTVLIEDGEYNITQIAFDERDRDTVYRSRDGGVILSGGLRLEPEDFTPWDKNENVKIIDLTKLGLGPEDWGKIYALAGHSNTAVKYEGGTGPQYSELFYNGERCVLARWPNGEGWLHTGRVLDSGDFLMDSGGHPVSPEEQERWEALSTPRGGTFLMDKETAARARGWQNPAGAWIIGMFKYDWAETVTPVQSIDKEKGAVTTAYASYYGFNQGKEYHFYNVLEELDAPGEWYLDRESGLLYIWPPDKAFDSARIDISLSAETLIQGVNLENIGFIGLTVQDTRGDGIDLSGDNLLVDHCVVQNIAGSAISVTGYNNTISNNEIRHVGRRGITLSGGDPETLAPGNNKAVNNLVHDWTELVLTNQGGLNVFGTGNLAAHNELCNSPHIAVFFGAGNVIEYNYIHDVCLGVSDAGAFYTGGIASSYGTVIRGNAVCNLGRFSQVKKNRHTPCGIYLDEMASGITVENNLLVNVPGSGIGIGGGRDLTVRGNVVVNSGLSYDDRARQGALFGGWNPTALPGGSYWQGLWSSPWQSEAWQAAYPELAALHDDFGRPDDPNFGPNPAGSVVTGNVFVGSDKPYYDEGVLRFSMIGPNDEYSLWRGRKYWTLPGYEKIPLEQIGRIGR